MSTVYLAFDPNVDRQVALKLLPKEFLHHPTFRERFDREAKIIASLEHPAIVPIYDFGEEDGQPYFVMRFMRGGSLSERLKNGPLSIDQAVAILERIGSALDNAHGKGVIHRDLKPANILFDQYNKAYLGDFGIARLQETGASLTGTVYLGTPAYMSPEQISSNTELTHRADIYALGVILYEVLTGDKPYMAQTAAGLALKHVTEPVPQILTAKPDLPPDFDNIISRAMAKDPEDRYPSAVDLTSEVSQLAVGGTIAAAARAAPPMDDATMIVGADLTSADPDASTTVLAGDQTAADAAAAGTVVDAVPGSDAASGTASGTAAGTGEITGSAAAPTTSRSYVPFAAGGMIILAIICLGVAAVAIFGSNDLFGGILGGDTATPTLPTLAATLANTATREPTETATTERTKTPTATVEPTDGATATPSPSPSPTEALVVPTLRPTNTPPPPDTPRPTRPRATATSPPPPTSPPQPTSPPPKPTSPPPKPTSPPAATKPPPGPTPIPP
jgi:serine/threonine-protein kinase